MEKWYIYANLYYEGDFDENIVNMKTHIYLQLQFEVDSAGNGPHDWIIALHRALANRYSEEKGWPCGGTQLWSVSRDLGCTNLVPSLEFMEGRELLLMLAENFSVGLTVDSAGSDDPKIVLGLTHRLDILDGDIYNIPAAGKVVLVSDGQREIVDLVNGEAIIPVSSLKKLRSSGHKIAVRVYADQPAIPSA